MDSQRTRIITVTGTKGKTSVVRALHYALQGTQDEPVLGVDTHRIVLGDKKVSSFKESRQTSGLVPTVCPGRFLLSLAGSAEPVAVLESSVGSSRSPGLGYRSHEIGIFTNVFDDHIGAKPYLSNRADLAEAKSFVFAKIKKGGTAVYNADEELIVNQLKKIPDDKAITRIACTLNTEYSSDTGYVVTIAGDSIVLCADGKTVLTVPISAQPWLFNGLHRPSLYNALFVFAALWAFCKDDTDRLEKAVRTLASYMPDESGSRMVHRLSDKGATVLIDFAHEAVSLTNIAEYAKKLAKGGRAIGVVRLSGERPDDHIVSTTRRFASHFDRLVIYEQQAVKNRQAGDVAALMQEAATSVGIPVQVMLDEQAALTYANEVSDTGDVVVYIVGSSIGSYALADKIFHFKKG